MKKNRQEKLIELISRYEIDTQDGLISGLRDHGFDVTQATISRDIRELNITKAPTGDGGYRYVLPTNIDSGEVSFGSTISGAVVAVDSACNIVVLKTRAGMAQAVAVGIDAVKLPHVLGSVAGDDTIMIVTRDTDSALATVDYFRRMAAQR